MGKGRRSGVAEKAKRGGPARGFWIALAGIALVGLGTLSFIATRTEATVTAVDPSLPPMKAEGYVMGSPTAPLEVIEFADFECPGCGQFATLTEPDIRTRLINTGKIRLRFMDYPLPMHKNTWDASLAAACANDQGRFWEMHDQIFATQDRWNGEATGRPRSVLADVAKSVGLDMSKYDACMDAETHRAKIQSHLQEAERRQVTQTPTFIIGGAMVPGAIPFDKFRELVDAALAKLPAGATAPASAPAAADSAAPAKGSGGR